MNVTKKLQEVADYFKKKIIDGDFEFIKCDEYKATIKIDGEHEVKVWIANDPKYNFEIYDSALITRNSAELLKFKTQKERLAGWRQVKKHVEAYRNNILKKQKEEELERLKKELEQLNS